MFTRKVLFHYLFSHLGLFEIVYFKHYYFKINNTENNFFVVYFIYKKNNHILVILISSTSLNESIALFGFICI